MNIFKIFRPELTDYTLRQYNKELRIMRENFGETDEHDLLFNIIDVSKDASVEGQFDELLESFCTDIAQASTRDEMLLGKPWTDEHKTHFRIRDLMDYLQRHRFMDMKTNQVAAKLKDMGAEHLFFNIRGRGVNAWVVPAYESEEPDIDIPDMTQDPF